MLKDSWKKYSLVIVLSFIVSILTMLHVILSFSKTPEGMVYLWTGHYYLDYFYYLIPIAQGSRGILLSFSQAATDDPTRFIHLWPYTLIGYLTKFLNLSPVAVYWSTVFILSFLFSLLIFVTIDKLLQGKSFVMKMTAFIFSLFATPFFIPIFEGSGVRINLHDFWYSMSTFFRRFEPIPHHLLSSIFILVSFLQGADLITNSNRWTYRKVLFKSIGVAVLLAAVLSFNSFSIIVPLAALSLTSILYMALDVKKRAWRSVIHLFIFLAILIGVVGVASLVLKNYYDQTIFASVFKNVEAALHQNISIKLLFLSHGPLVVFALLGLPHFIRGSTPLKVLFTAFFLLSYLFYFSSLDRILGTHNGRFLSPVSYILIGSCAILGIARVSISLGRLRKMAQVILIVFVLAYFVPANLKVFNELLTDRNISSPISYLPKGIITGFRFLDKYPGRGDVLLTPSQFLGTVMPIFVNRRTYVSRQIITPNYIDKNMRTSNFYLGAMSQEEAHRFLKENGLEFVALTSIEGYDVKVLFRYEFLKEIYRNKDIIIFKVI